MFCQVPGCLDTLLGQPPPERAPFFSWLRVLQRSRRIRTSSLSSILIVDTFKGDKSANNHLYLPEILCKKLNVACARQPADLTPLVVVLMCHSQQNSEPKNDVESLNHFVWQPPTHPHTLTLTYTQTHTPPPSLHKHSARDGNTNKGKK